MWRALFQQLVSIPSMLAGAVCVTTGALTAAEPAAPTVETHAASALGMTGLTANGRIQPHTLPTSYYFEYGPTTAYGSKTAQQPLPPRLAAYYHETWNDGLSGWMGGMG